MDINVIMDTFRKIFHSCLWHRIVLCNLLSIAIVRRMLLIIDDPLHFHHLYTLYASISTKCTRSKKTLQSIQLRLYSPSRFFCPRFVFRESNFLLALLPSCFRLFIERYQARLLSIGNHLTVRVCSGKSTVGEKVMSNQNSYRLTILRYLTIFKRYKFHRNNVSTH